MFTRFDVASEVGTLRRVLLHRPDLELRRLTPTQRRRPALRRRAVGEARPPGARRLRRHAARARRRGALRRRAARRDRQGRRRPRAGCSTGRSTSATSAPTSPPPSATGSTTLDPESLATHLIGGLTAARAPRRLGPRAAGRGGSETDGFVLPPLPNHLFTRDTSCWIGGGVSVNPMALPARRRETANLEAIYRFHPLFAERSRSGLVRRRRRRPTAPPRSKAATSSSSVAAP